MTLSDAYVSISRSIQEKPLAVLISCIRVSLLRKVCSEDVCALSIGGSCLELSKKEQKYRRCGSASVWRSVLKVLVIYERGSGILLLLLPPLFSLLSALLLLALFLGAVGCGLYEVTDAGISVCSLQRTPSVTVQRKQPINPAKAAANKSSEKAANKF